MSNLNDIIAQQTQAVLQWICMSDEERAVIEEQRAKEWENVKGYFEHRTFHDGEEITFYSNF